MRRLIIFINWFVFILLLVGCTQAADIQTSALCPAGVGQSNWTIIQPESVEFLENQGLEIGDVKNFRFLVVTTNGLPPAADAACANALVYPKTENLAVFSTLVRNEKMNAISDQALLTNHNHLPYNQLYVYFVGIDAGYESADVNQTLPAIVQAIRQAIAQALTQPETGYLAKDTTQILLREYSDYVTEKNMVDYGSFTIQPDRIVWGTNFYATHSTNGRMFFRYRVRNYQSPATEIAAQTVTQLAPYENVIQNGDFDSPYWTEVDSVAPNWQGYSANGSAGLLREQWPEAVLTPPQSHLLTLRGREPLAEQAVVAIHQTVSVVPNSTYDLIINALMRSSAPANARDQGAFQMDWGIDYTGSGNYSNVYQWFSIPVREQAQIGSNANITEYIPLEFEQTTAKILSGNRSQITLFVRGAQNENNGFEVNFNIDNVALNGPAYVTVPVEPEVITPTTEVAGTTPVTTTTPAQPTAQDAPVSVPDDKYGFLIYVAQSYNEINGKDLPLQGVHLDADNQRGQRVVLDVTNVGASIFQAETEQVQIDFTNRLLDDALTYFDTDSLVRAVILTSTDFETDATQAECVNIEGVLGCPNLEQSDTYSIVAENLLEIEYANGEKTVQK